MSLMFFFFNDPATTEIYTLSLHDALPIFPVARGAPPRRRSREPYPPGLSPAALEDRKSTRLNSSHQIISYAVFCLKKKNNMHHPIPITDESLGDVIAQGQTNGVVLLRCNN